jgi:hypothetical protein
MDEIKIRVEGILDKKLSSDFEMQSFGLLFVENPI